MKQSILPIIFTGLLIACQNEPSQNLDVQFVRVPSRVLTADTSSSPSASWIDIDDDGDDDLYVLNGYDSLEDPPTPQANKFYRNDGKGNFTSLPDHSLVQDVTFSGSGVWGDYDNDGDPDLFVANQHDANNFLYRNDGHGKFTRITEGSIVNDGGQSFSAAWIDVDNDGWLDLHVLNGRANPEGQKDFLYRNLGDGNFKRMANSVVTKTVLPSGGASWGDYDNDGDPDVVVPVNSSSQKFRVYRNEKHWNFTDVTETLNLTDDPLPYSPKCSVAQWIDYDNDLDLDLFIGNVGTIDYLFNNDGSGKFTRVRAGRIGLDATYVSDLTWGDFDNDGDLDFVMAVWGGASRYYENNGKNEFYPALAGDLESDIDFASSVSVNDVDNDGDLDLFLTQWPINKAGGAPNLLFRNEGRHGHWVKIDLEGRQSNKSGIGARIIVTAIIRGQEKKQLRVVRSRTSWRSSGGLTQHFGLGDEQQIEKIEIRWPSGHIDTLAGKPVDRKLVFREGVMNSYK